MDSAEEMAEREPPVSARERRFAGLLVYVLGSHAEGGPDRDGEEIDAIVAEARAILAAPETPAAPAKAAIRNARRAVRRAELTAQISTKNTVPR